MSISDNVREVIVDINEAALRVGRDPQEITLVAVSKTRTPEEIEDAIEAGIVHFGENRLQEASSKIPRVTGGIVWHLVGHLQSNKAKAAVELFDWIDSVHSKEIADIISNKALQKKKAVNVLIQVNISREESKSGIPVGEVKELVSYVAGREGITVRGLMTIGSFGVSEQVTRSEYSRMKELFDSLKEYPETGSQMDVLSMGMSDDFKIAIEEGATMLRVGTAIFGKRS